MSVRLRRNRQKQVVVVIHGIGRHQPMETLRSFVSGIGFPRAFARDNSLASTMELRKLVVPRSKQRPETEFVEFYWSHYFLPGRVGKTASWIGRTVFSRWDGNMRLPVLAFRTFLTGCLVALILGVPWALRRPEGPAAVVALLSIPAIGLVIWRFLSRTLMDASRYLAPAPRDIPARDAIRDAGARLLRDLHDDPHVARIIVVGHSLGSLIGYDILRKTFPELRTPSLEQHEQQPVATEFARKIRASFAVDDLSDQRAREAQVDQALLWFENRGVGVPWKVTDFITLGSPLAHAPVLLRTRSRDFATRAAEGEFPTCPPTFESTSKDDILYQEHHRLADGSDTNCLACGRRSVFASTRWTNIYAPVRFPFWGDPIGGALRPVFGRGVRDREVISGKRKPAPFRIRLFPTSHTAYWRDVRARNVLLDALSLDVYRAKGPVPWRPSAP